MKNLLILVLLFSSCKPVLYIPDKIHSSGLKKEGDLKIGVSGRLEEETLPKSYCLDIAYAPIPHLALIGSYHKFEGIVAREHIYNDSNVSSDDAFDATLNGRYFEIGAGYFTKLTGNQRVELIGGYGNVSNHCSGGRPLAFSLDPTVYAFNGRYDKFFVQADYEVGSDKCSAVFGLRETRAQYASFGSVNTILKYSLTKDKEDVRHNIWQFTEPYFEGRAGGKRLKFFMQTGFCIRTSGPELSKNIFGPYFMIGATFHVSTKLSLLRKSTKQL